MSEKYPVNNYVPTAIDNVYDLHTRLNRDKYNEIISDFDYHFKNSYITNFDLIHNECRGDKLEYSRKFYETIYSERIKKNLREKDRHNFCASALKSERKDLHFEKKVLEDHFKKRDDLESRGIYLSSMRKKFCKKTEDCKSLKF